MQISTALFSAVFLLLFAFAGADSGFGLLKPEHIVPATITVSAHAVFNRAPASDALVASVSSFTDPLKFAGQISAVEIPHQDQPAQYATASRGPPAS